MKHRSALLSHLIALCDYQLRAEKRRALYLTSNSKPARWSRLVENDEYTSAPFIATQFTHLTSMYGPLINPEGAA